MSSGVLLVSDFNASAGQRITGETLPRWARGRLGLADVVLMAPSYHPNPASAESSSLALWTPSLAILLQGLMHR